MRRLALLGCLTVWLVCGGPVGCCVPGRMRNLPTPVAAVAYGGWSEAFRLDNGRLEVVVVPASGRIVSLRLRGGPNLLREDESLAGQFLDERSGVTWLNAGGDWIWPVSQARWTSMAEADWPPPVALADRPWRGTAWVDADGTQCCRLSREYGEPVNIRVSRTLRLAPGPSAALTIEQRIGRTAASAIPVVLWNISQVAAPSCVYLPVREASVFDGGVKVLMGERPDRERLEVVDGVAIYRAGLGGEAKLGTDCLPAWIAAEKEGYLVLERTDGNPDGPYPDGGCTLEMYANAGLGYAEIETLSPEVLLAKGDVLSNRLTIECHRLPDNLSEPEKIKWVRGLDQ